MIDAYRLDTDSKELAAQFGVKEPGGGLVPLVSPGEYGYSVRQDEGIRQIQRMTWGFPDEGEGPSASRVKPLPFIDNLLDPYWYGLVSKPWNRCLIPATTFSISTGGKPIWFRPRSQPLLAFGALWRGTYEWGLAFALVLTDFPFPTGSAPAAPLIVQPQDFDVWLSGTHEDALALHARPMAPNTIQVVTGTVE